MMTQKIKAKCIAIKQNCHDTKTFTFELEKPLNFTAGQFIMLNIPRNGILARRSYSIASPPNNTKAAKQTIDICLNYLPGGAASEFLFNLKDHETIEIDGPYGLFTVDKNLGKDKIFIATGTGVAPIRAIIHDLFEKGVKENITLLFGERTEEEILFRNEFEQLAKQNKNFKYIVTLSNPHNNWKGEAGYIQTIMKKYINDIKNTEFYICGLKEMVDDVKKELLSMGTDPRNIFTERFV